LTQILISITTKTFVEPYISYSDNTIGYEVFYWLDIVLIWFVRVVSGEAKTSSDTVLTHQINIISSQ